MVNGEYTGVGVRYQGKGRAMAGISLNTKIEQLYKLLENCKVYLSPSDLQRQSDVIPLLRHIYDLVRLPAVK